MSYFFKIALRFSTAQKVLAASYRNLKGHYCVHNRLSLSKESTPNYKHMIFTQNKLLLLFVSLIIHTEGHEVAQRYATRVTVAGSIPDEVNECSSIYLILPAVFGPGVFSASNRNEYQKQKNTIWGLMCGQYVRMKIAPSSVCRLSRHVRSLTSHNPIGLHGLLRG
jgi:hypothetical protein